MNLPPDDEFGALSFLDERFQTPAVGNLEDLDDFVSKESVFKECSEGGIVLSVTIAKTITLLETERNA
jgi:hypothetical protein